MNLNKFILFLTPSKYPLEKKITHKMVQLLPEKEWMGDTLYKTLSGITCKCYSESHLSSSISSASLCSGEYSQPNLSSFWKKVQA